MTDRADPSREAVARLEQRAKRLALEKSSLQLVIHLMGKLATAVGLDDTLQNMLSSVMEAIGGTNLVLYYFIDGKAYSADVFGVKHSLDEISDAHVREAITTGEFAEYEHDFADTRMLTSKFTKAHTWVYPLRAGPEIIGVLKMEGLHVAASEFPSELPVFFNYAALVLKNEILGYTSLQQAYERLEEEIEEHRQLELALSEAKGELERRVDERTRELQEANGQLQVELAERLRSEEALRVSEEMMHKAQEYARLGSWVWDLQTGRLEWSEEMFQIFGIDRAEFDESLAGVMARAIHPDDRDKVVEANRQVLEEGRPAPLDYRIVWPDGSVHVIWGEAGELERDEYGAPLRLRGFAQDITARKSAEMALEQSTAELRAIYDNAPVMMCVLDSERRVCYANPAFAMFTGNVDTELRGERTSKVFGCVYAMDDARGCGFSANCANCALRLAIDDTFKTGVGHHNVEFNATLSRQGALREVSLLGSTALVHSADQSRLLLCLIDVTERKTEAAEKERLEAQLRQSQKMEAIGQLAGGVAHDFNNLLLVIQGYTAMVQEHIGPDSQDGEELDEVRKAAERAADLTRQLLTFSRRQVIQPVDIDLNSVIEHELKMIRRIIGENIDLRFLPGPRATTVHADRAQLAQILMNLCVNARDAMPKGGVLTIATEEATLDGEFCRGNLWAKPGTYVVTKVVDTGHGMDAGVCAQIFEPFFTTKGVGKGTGLGLATVYGIVQQHQGLIDVESAPGAGTTFRVYFPAVERVRNTAPSDDEAPVAGGAETILLAEDEEGGSQLSPANAAFGRIYRVGREGR